VNGRTASESIGSRPGGVVRIGSWTPTGDAVGRVAFAAFAVAAASDAAVENGGAEAACVAPGDCAVDVDLVKTDRTRPHKPPPSLARAAANAGALVSAWANSPADANRSAGVFAIALAMARST
jgi:hypothetical protein